MHRSRTSIASASAAVALALSACAPTTNISPDLASGADAYEAIAPEAVPAPIAYQIAPRDKLSLGVFGEPDLTLSEVTVDGKGNLQIPLVGEIQAAGMSPSELSATIASALGRRYIRNPQVTVNVIETAPRFVTVEGDVRTPGVYEIGDKSTLLSALARAQSPTETAKVEEVIIFRTIDGRRAAGLFNVADIRGGAAPDPQIMDGDVVTVGTSGTKLALQNILRAAPFANAFVLLAR